MEPNIKSINIATASVSELREFARDLVRVADEKATFEDEAYRKFLADRRAALRVGDKIQVEICGRKIKSQVKGFSTNYYGQPFVKFVIDWDEGPIEYNWNVSLVEKV